MKIKLKGNYYEYNNIMRGQFFLYEGTLYLKIDVSGNIPNAFNCDANQLTDFDSMTLVKPIDIVLQEV